MSTSSIEWTELTWNPTTGCSKISAGCKFCYAEVMSRRLKGMGVKKYQDGFKIKAHKDSLELPYSWRKPKIVFVNSMSDLFHPGITDDFIKRVFKVMNNNPQHIFQVLTKRAERLLKLNQQLKWTSNIWMGVSIENEKVINRVEYLIETSAKIKFLSCEPLIGPLPNLTLENIDWVIVGGESGRKPRPIEEAWVSEILKQCRKAGTKFFFKQWGGIRKKVSGRKLNGRYYNEMPALKGTLS